MDSFRKWFYRPRRDDPSLLAQFYYADEELNLVASELDTFDGRKDPERCTALVNQLRHCQDKVVSLCMTMMEAVIPGERANRDFRAKFPDDVMQENLAGQLWFGAECLAAGSSILNRESESSRMRPLAKAVTKTIETVRNLLREQCLKPVPEYTEKIRESLKIFDRLFSEFELSYVSAMVPVKSPEEHEVLQGVVVLFSETVHRALVVQLITQDQVDDCDPALMFTIPRLAIVAGLLLYPDGPLNLATAHPRNLSYLFRPFKTLLSKIRELLWTMSAEELSALEGSLCSLDEPLHSSLALPETLAHCHLSPSKPENDIEAAVEDMTGPCYAHIAYTSNFIQSFLARHPDSRTLTADTNLLPQSDKRAASSSSRSRSERKRDYHRSGGHRSSSNRTRLRQKRLSDRFLAKLTGLEDRPRAKIRPKRTSSASLAQIDGSCVDSISQEINAVHSVDEFVSNVTRTTHQSNEETEREHRRHSAGDAYCARRREYLAQQEAIRRRRTFFQHVERLQRQRIIDSTNVLDTHYTTSYGFGDRLEQQEPPTTDTLPATRSLPPRHFLPRGRDTSPRESVSPVLPPQYTLHNDSDSDQEVSEVSQHRHRPRRHKQNNSAINGTQYSKETGAATQKSSNSLPRVPSQITNSVNDDSFNNFYAHPEPLPRQSIRHSGHTTHNHLNTRSTNYEECRQDFPPSSTILNSSRTVNGKRSPPRQNNIETIDCSCGSAVQSTAEVYNEPAGRSQHPCIGTCRGQDTDTFNSNRSQNSELNDCSVNNTVNRPTSFYIPPENFSITNEDGTYSTVVNIGDCVSSVVAADPTIFGPHNLYLNQDMPPPNYHITLTEYHLDDHSPSNTESFNEEKVNTILEEPDETPTTYVTTPSVCTLRDAISSPINNYNRSIGSRNYSGEISVSDSSTLIEDNQTADNAVTCSNSSAIFSEGSLAINSIVEVSEESATQQQDNIDVSSDTREVGIDDSDGDYIISNSTASISGNASHCNTVATDGVDSYKQRLHEDVGESSSSTGSDCGVMTDDELNDEEVALALQAAEVAAAWRARARFSDPRDLIQRLFVCISGVADQLQTNYASDLRRILKAVFLLSQTTSQGDEELLQEEKEDKSSIHDHDGHSTSNESESLSVESAEDALAGICSSQPSSPCHSSQRAGDDTEDDRSPVLQYRLPAVGNLPPTVCAPPAVFSDHALLQFSEATQTVSSPPSSSTTCTEPATAAPVTTEATDVTPVSREVTVRRDEPPSWVPDHEAPRCMACGASFTVLRRRHHCRNCGKVFCGACSQHSVPLTHYGIWKPVRVCNMCFLQYVTSVASS